MKMLKRAIRRHRKRASFAVIALAAMVPGLAQAAPSLTDAERRAYLEYYAPLLMKRGNGNNGDAGRDWMANFDYDRDGVFANNGANFRANLVQYIDASRRGDLNHPVYKRWNLRPTMYTALIEFMEGSRKDLVLIYHVYHPHDENAKNDAQLHDWEVIELRIKNVAGRPGTGEYVDFVTITNHHRNLLRRRSDNDLQFMSTSTGRHVMIWQAEWSGKVYSSHGQELRFVQDSYAGEVQHRMNTTRDAEVDLTNHSSDKNVHYVFVPESSSAAVSAWRAKPLNFQTAYSLASTADNGNTIDWRDVKRITYELQDVADIMPTHYSGNDWRPHWKSDSEDRVQVLMRSGLTARQPGLNNVPASGVRTFYTTTKDVLNEDGRSGYPNKKWFWGVHDAYEDACDNWNLGLSRGPFCKDDDYFKDDAFAGNYYGRDKYGRTRDAANDTTTSTHGRYWYQHDYFVHDGRLNGSSRGEPGHWLTGAWYTAANGGFDGRWVQLFDDRPNHVPVGALSMTLSVPSTGCLGHSNAYARGTGGATPYTVTWVVNGHRSVSTTNGTSYRALLNGQRGTVTIRSADGQSQTRSFSVSGSCEGGVFY